MYLYVLSNLLHTYLLHEMFIYIIYLLVTPQYEGFLPCNLAQPNQFFGKGILKPGLVNDDKKSHLSPNVIADECDHNYCLQYHFDIFLRNLRLVCNH